MTEHLRERIKRQAIQNFVGREQELAQLLHLLNNQKTPVVFVHGIGGIGKSSLLEAFARQAQTLGAIVIKLDCRSIKPSIEGFLHELAIAIGSPDFELEQIIMRLSQLGERVVIMLDTYELYRMMDTWLRQVFIPALHEKIHVIFFGREAPVSSWFTTPGWDGMVQSIQLGSLSNIEARELLLHYSIPEMDIQQMIQFTHGHPLALKLAAATAAQRPNLHLKEVESQHIIGELTQLYISDVPDPVSRMVLEAASVVRRSTYSLLGAMLPDIAPNDAYHRLQTLPFIENTGDGLMIHELVQQAIVSNLRAVDPARYNKYRRTAWQQLRTEFSPSSRAMLWRYNADMIYLIDNPIIHDVFFPSDTHVYDVEQASSEDWVAIQEITLRHDGPETLAIIQYWWNLIPDAFSVVRGQQGEVAGFNCLLVVDPSTTQLQFDDAITRIWWQHLQANPIPKRQLAVFALKYLGAENGDGAHPVLGPLMLDAKRTYLENPQARLVFALEHTQDWIPFNEELGFRILDWVTLDNKDYFMSVNDFGPQLVPGWMASLVDSELGLAPPIVLNVEARELLIAGTGIGLTPLEFHLMQYLCQREGKAVSRDEILNEVWGYNYDGGSNVVDRIVRSLRRKLGEHSKAIETVSGVGYKLRWSK